MVTAWVYQVSGINGRKLPVIFLDTNLEKNSEEDRLLTGYLYGGDSGYRQQNDANDAASLYDKLERVIVPMYYKNKEEYLRVMRNAIAFNASYFNSTRMVKQYLVRAYAKGGRTDLMQLVTPKILSN